MTESTRHKAMAGRCPTCNTRTLRGLDNTGQNVEVELPALTAAAELTELIAGRPTWLARWRSARIELTARQPADVRDSPAGYTPGNVYAAHRCNTETR